MPSTDTLYDKLKSIENGMGQVSQAMREFNSHLHESTPNPIEDYKKETFRCHKNAIKEVCRYNFVLKRAYDGEKSVSETLDDLIVTNRSWHQWFPKKRDQGLNDEVEATAELVGDLNFLKTRWKYAWDNVATGAVYGGLLAVGGVFIASLAVKGHYLLTGQELDPTFYQMDAYLKVAAGVLGPIVGGWNGSNQRHQKNKHRKEAKYIDEKIKKIKKE